MVVGCLFCLQRIDYYFVAQSDHVTEQVIHICSREILIRAGPPCIASLRRRGHLTFVSNVFETAPITLLRRIAGNAFRISLQPD